MQLGMSAQQLESAAHPGRVSQKFRKKKCHSELTVYANIVCGAVLAVVIILVADSVHVPTIGVVCAMFFALTILADVTFLESGLCER